MSDHHEFFNKHAERAERAAYIDPSLHAWYNTKRGLRNNDGTGVLIGLTELGDVHGYIVDENERMPVEGRLRYRGIDVSEIVRGFQADGRFGFEETAYLLLFGALPTETELDWFRRTLAENRDLPSGFAEHMILRAPSGDLMNKLARSVLVSYSYDPEAEERSIENILRQCIQLIARFPVFAAYAYQAKSHYYDDQSLFIHAPDPEMSTAENLLQLIRADQVFTPLEAEVLDLALVLHAEHGGGNNSAFAIHVVSSADTDTYSAVAAAIGSLKGSKHGGANNRVMGMMDYIKEQVEDWTDTASVERILGAILRKEGYDRRGLIYGMGHAVYTISDPRAVLLKERAADLAKSAGREREFALYDSIERLTPKVFSEVKRSDKVIAPNVDFYSGFVYDLLGVPRDLFTPIFAVSRIAGWCAHRIEEVVSNTRIIRPAYKNVAGRVPYARLEDRA